MSKTPKEKVASQGAMLVGYAERMSEQTQALARRGKQLENASEALEPERAAAVYHESIAHIATVLSNAGRAISRVVLGQDGDVPRFDLADAEIGVFLEPEDDYAADEDFDDPDAVTDINRRLDAGDTAAWCVLTVRVAWRGFAGTDSLGGVSLEPGTPVPATLAHANDHDMLATAVQNLARTVRDAGWDATFPLPNRGNVLADSQAITHREPGCPTCGPKEWPA